MTFEENDRTFEDWVQKNRWWYFLNVTTAEIVNIHPELFDTCEQSEECL